MNEPASGLIDIIEPAVPIAPAAGSWLWVAVTGAVLVSLVIALLALWKNKWPAYRAIKHLRKLHQQVIAGELTPSDGVVLLVQELRHGLRLPQQLTKEAPQAFSQQDKHLWEGFVGQLDALRYQPGEMLTAAHLEPYFSQIEIWLQRYCR